MRIVGCVLTALMALAAAPAFAGPDCGYNAAGFEQWLPDMKREAMGGGNAPGMVEQAL